MNLADILIKRALFPGKSSGIMAAIWNADIEPAEDGYVQISEYCPTMEQLRGGLFFISEGGKFFPVSFNNTDAIKMVEIPDTDGVYCVLFHYNEEWLELFLVPQPNEYGVGIQLYTESGIRWTANPMIIVW